MWTIISNKVKLKMLIQCTIIIFKRLDNSLNVLYWYTLSTLNKYSKATSNEFQETRSSVINLI